MRPRRHERHNLGGVGWLRASVLGANDGIVSTSSLILGVAAGPAGDASCGFNYLAFRLSA